MSTITSLPQDNLIERKEITISISGARLKLSDPSVNLNPSERRELVWRFTGTQPGDLMIEFKAAQNASGYDSPFRGSLFRCPKGGSSLSGRPVADKARSKTYTYIVTLTIKNADGTTTVRTATGAVTLSLNQLTGSADEKKPLLKSSVPKPSSGKTVASKSAKAKSAKTKSAKTKPASPQANAKAPKARPAPPPKSKKTASQKASKKTRAKKP